MKKALFILLVLTGIVFRIVADNQGTQNTANNADQPHAAAAQSNVSADNKTAAVKEVGKNTGENTVQPQKKESSQGKQSAPTGTPAADTKLDTGSKPSTDNKPAANAGKKDPTTTNKTVQSENNDVSNEDNTVPDEGRSEYTQNKADAAVVSNLAAAVESANRSAKKAEMDSRQALSELKQYGRYWEEHHNEMSVFVKILSGVVLLCMLLMFAILCILFSTLKKRVYELEKTFRQQINSLQKSDNQAKDTLHRQRNSIDKEPIQEATAHHRLNDWGDQDRSSQAAVKTDIGRKQPIIRQSPKTETVRAKSTGYAEESNDKLSYLYVSEAERKKWFSSSPSYSCLIVPERIGNRLYIGETISSAETEFTISGSKNNTLFILLDDKYVYLNFWLYNAEKELPANIEHIIRLVYDFDQPLPRYVKDCRPALVRKTSDGYKIQQKGRIVLA